MRPEELVSSRPLASERRKVIPKEIAAQDIEITAPISGWLLQFMSTNWSGYWILQLTKEQQNPVAMLLNLDHLTNICIGMRKAIDAALNPESFPHVTMMNVKIADNILTNLSDSGSITVISEWNCDKIATINYYPSTDRIGIVRQTLYIADAMELCDMFSCVYNKFPDKHTWIPKSITPVPQTPPTRSFAAIVKNLFRRTQCL